VLGFKQEPHRASGLLDLQARLAGLPAGIVLALAKLLLPKVSNMETAGSRVAALFDA
jgi:hypothetical protein